MTEMPVKIVIGLKDAEELELTLNELEKVRSSHPDTTLDVEIRVHPEN